MPPKVSIFTPTHDPRFIYGAYRSILAQDFEDWEWVVYLNNAAVADPIFGSLGLNDPRVKLVADDRDINGVGAAKKAAVSLCEAPILVELDHDDLLEPTALSEVYRAFQSHPDASLVYSRTTSIKEDGSPHTTRYGSVYGWTYEERDDGLQVPINMTPTPHNASLIWFQPNHLRAFTRKAYDAVGGYDENLRICDDQDLMCRLYLHGEWLEIPKLLYRQRIHGLNTQYLINADIQTTAWEVYDKYIYKIASKWAERKGLQVIESAGFFWKAGVIRIESPGKLLVSPSRMEAYSNALAPNGMLLIKVPERDYINEHYFKAWRSTDTARFQESRIVTVEEDGRNWVYANLISVKPGYTRDGGVLYTHDQHWSRSAGSLS